MPATRLTDFNVATAVQQLQHVDPNLSLIQLAVRDILKAKLGLVIDKMNTDFNLSITKPTKFSIAPSDLSDKYIGSVLVSINIETEAIAPREFTNFSNITVYVIGHPLSNLGNDDEMPQVEELWQRAAAVRAVLYQFLKGYIDEFDRRLWGQLVPQPYMLLPEEWADYSGISVPFRGRHDPGHNAWTPIAP